MEMVAPGRGSLMEQQWVYRSDQDHLRWRPHRCLRLLYGMLNSESPRPSSASAGGHPGGLRVKMFIAVLFNVQYICDGW